MKKFASSTFAAVLLLAASIGLGADKDQPLQTPQLSAEHAKWRGLVLPNPKEQSYRKIDGVHIEGKWNAKGPGIPTLQTRGIDARLEGQAVYDLKAEKFVSFDLL